MYCRVCGTEYNGNFCPACGAQQTPSAGPAQQNQIPVQQTGGMSVATNSTTKKKKPFYKRVGFWLLMIIALLIIIGGFKLCKKAQPKSEPWPKTGLGATLPEPPGIIKIHWDKEDSFRAEADKTTADNYREYLDKCIELGYTVEAKKSSSDYEAFNDEGYKLTLRSYSDEISIQLDAPLKLETLRWPAIADEENVPRPDSNLGKINYEYADHFSLYVGETSAEQFNAYIEKCMEAGFAVDYERGEDYFRAYNEDGYRLKLNYRGFGTFKIELDQPEDDEPTEAPATVGPKTNTDVPEITDAPATPTNEPAGEKVDYSVGEAQVTVFQSSIGTNWIKVVVPVKNTGNTNLYMSSCSIDIEYSNGTLADALKNVSVYPQVVKPGETAYYYEETTFDGTETNGLKAVPHVKAEKAKVDLIRFEVSEAKMSNEGYFGTKVTGRVKNTSDKPDSLIYVVANFFDSNGNLIGQQFTILSDESAVGEKVGFETSSVTSHLNEDEIASFDVIAFPYQFQF